MLHSLGMVEILQRSVAEAATKVHAQETAKVANLEEARAATQRQAEKQARQHELALKKIKDKQAAVEQERKAAQAEVWHLGSRLYHTRTTLQEERAAKEQLEHSPAPSEKPRIEKLRASSPVRATLLKDIRGGHPDLLIVDGGCHSLISINLADPTSMLLMWHGC